MDILINFLAQWGKLPLIVQIVGVLMALHPVASAIVALTPTPRDNNILAKVYKVVEALSLTVGKAKEKSTDANWRP